MQVVSLECLECPRDPGPKKADSQMTPRARCVEACWRSCPLAIAGTLSDGVQDPESWVQYAGPRILDLGHRILGPGTWPGSWIQDPGSRILDSIGYHQDFWWILMETLPICSPNSLCCRDSCGVSSVLGIW